MPNVLNGIELAFTSCLPASSARACSSVLSLFILLHLRCVSLQFVKLYGSPPRETGMSSSTSALIGCGVFNVLSTGLPQMAHTSYDGQHSLPEHAPPVSVADPLVASLAHGHSFV